MALRGFSPVEVYTTCVAILTRVGSCVPGTKLESLPLRKQGLLRSSSVSDSQSLITLVIRCPSVALLDWLTVVLKPKRDRRHRILEQAPTCFDRRHGKRKQNSLYRLTAALHQAALFNRVPQPRSTDNSTC